MPKGLDGLSDQIRAAEQKVYEADDRALASAQALRAHWRARWKAAVPKMLYGTGGAIALTVVAGLLLRGRRLPRRAGAGLRSAGGSLRQLAASARPLLQQMAPRLVTAGTAVLAGMLTQRPAQPLTAAAQVDLERFAGTWHEIARLPESAEKDCQSDITTTYVMTDQGLRILNRCRRKDGTIKRAFGHAEIVPGTGNARLKVSFAPKLLDALPFVWSELTIVDVADDYGSAILATPNRKHLWLIAREPEVSEEVRRSFVTKALAQGFDTSKLIYNRATADAGTTAAA